MSIPNVLDFETVLQSNPELRAWGNRHSPRVPKFVSHPPPLNPRALHLHTHLPLSRRVHEEKGAPCPRVNGSCAYWKKLVLVRNTFPPVPHPLNQQPLPLAAGAGTSGVWGSCQKQGWGCLFFSGMDRSEGGGVLNSLPICCKLKALFAREERPRRRNRCGRRGLRDVDGISASGRQA